MFLLLSLFSSSANSQPIDTVASPALEARVKEEIANSHRALMNKFGSLPDLKFPVSLVTRDKFNSAIAGTPWISAYFDGQSLVFDLDELEKASPERFISLVHHEYSHAVIFSLSNGKCPAWLDEGLALIAGGGDRSQLFQAFSDWTENRKPLLLSSLDRSLTNLSDEATAVAYAESLIATEYLVKHKGFAQIKGFLSALKQNFNPAAAFQGAFGKNYSQLEAIILLRASNQDSFT